MLNRWAFGGLILAFALVILDLSGTPVILPGMKASLSMSNTDLQWIINIYILIMAFTVIPVGKLGDRFGLKKLFLFGNGIFIAASILCAIAPNFTVELIGRILQGVGGSIIFPIGIAIIPHLVEEDKVTHGIGKVIGVNCVIYIIGGLIAGAFEQWLTWRLFFFINIPIGLFALWVLWKRLPDLPIAQAKKRIDKIGVLFSALFVFGVVFGVTESSNFGWDHPIIIASFILAIVSLIIYITSYRFIKNPMINFGIFRKKNFSGTILSLGIWQGIILAFTYVLIYSQFSWGYSPIEAGMLALIMGIPATILSTNAGKICDAITHRGSLLLGFVVLTVGYAWVALTISHGHWYELIIPILLIGSGLPLIMSSATAKCMMSAGPEYRGVASGLIYAVRYTIGSILFALLGLFFGRQASEMETVMWMTAGFAIVAFIVLLLFTRVEKTS